MFLLIVKEEADRWGGHEPVLVALDFEVSAGTDGCFVLEGLGQPSLRHYPFVPRAAALVIRGFSFERAAMN